MKRYTLTDTVRLEVRRVRDDRWAFYTVTGVRSDGTRWTQPPVATPQQAQERAREWFPNATVALTR